MQHRVAFYFLQDGTSILAGHVEVQQNEARIGLTGKLCICAFPAQIFEELHTVLNEINRIAEL